MNKIMDYTPMTSEEAHLRILEAEQGIANGEVVSHEEVMKHSYELLAKYSQSVAIDDLWK